MSLSRSQVSCGPYHTAAVTTDGELYTWGNGQFGRLGHGDTTSVFTPRRVQALVNHFVVQASCGFWHTAAVACPRARAGSLTSSLDPSASVDPSASAVPSASQIRASGAICMDDSSTSFAPSASAAPSNDRGGDRDGGATEPLLSLPSSSAMMPTLSVTSQSNSDSDVASVLGATVGASYGGGRVKVATSTDTLMECLRCA